MPNLNKVMLMGNLTRDPEVKYTPKGTAIAVFTIATNRKYSLETGEKREEVTFVDVEAYGKQAEVIGEYVKKGRPLYVEGRLKMDQWDDKATGQKRSKMKVVVEAFEFLGSREGGPGGGGGSSGTQPDEYADSQAAPPPQRRAPSQAPRPPADPDLDAAPDDIPF